MPSINYLLISLKNFLHFLFNFLHKMHFTGVVQSVDIFVQSVGVRSIVTPIYGELVFRRACRDVRANLGYMISLWYLGAGDSAIVQSLADGRKDFAAISYGGRIIILGGSSRTTDNLADAYQSSIIEVSGWELLLFPEYRPRWSPRVNLTVRFIRLLCFSCLM